MKRNPNAERRKMSFGSRFMLTLLVLVLAGSALVIGRLSSGATVDLSKLNMKALNLSEGNRQEGKETAAQKTAEPAPETQEASPATEVPGEQAGAAPALPRQFTLTIGGTVWLSDEMHRNCLTPDSKIYDYSDIMMLLAPSVRADLSVAFTENILSDEYKAGNTVAPESAASILKEGGFGMAACGFGDAFAKGESGVQTTQMAMLERGIRPVGIREKDEQGMLEIREEGGVKTAVLQYTTNVSSKTRKSMEKAGTSGMVPEAEISLIEADIARARSEGAEAVIVLVNWGQNGKKVSKQQRELAEGIAGAGADLIVGCGSRIPQAAEYLSGKDGRSVLCCWSLGSLLSGDRSNTKHTAGYLLHAVIRANGRGGADVLNPEYTPVYTWEYKQDSRYYYRCVAASGEAPDGMDSKQRANMEKASEAVREVLDGSPVTLRETD